MKLSEEDIKYIQGLGLTPKDVERQISLLRSRPKYLRLKRSVGPHNGVKILSEDSMKRYLDIYTSKAKSLSPIKFVPASGAATRMFQDLIRAYDSQEDLDRLFLTRYHQDLDEHLKNAFYFLENIDKFAFYAELKNVFKNENLRIEEVIKKGEVRKILERVLFKPGLGYLGTPKALVRFHAYLEDDVRTALEEHLVEGSYYATGEDNVCRMHFTVDYTNTQIFSDFLEAIKGKYSKRLECEFQIEISEQDPSTNTVAIDRNGNLVRDEDGRILLRPGGHGALLSNLQKLRSPIVFIKNIDNVCHDHLKPDVILWKKILGGVLLDLRERIFEFIRGLQEGTAKEREVEEFLVEELFYPPRAFEDKTSPPKKLLLKILKRPMRVCGVVSQIKEPGGAPFWVEAPSGQERIQIVEKAQVDMEDEQQKEIFFSSPYFNPVDIVCCILDESNMPYDLTRFTDPSTYMVSEKDFNGRSIRVLEHPGLWNGQMADWISLFVEVPRETFYPVKTVLDLLRKGHRPGLGL